MKKILISLAIIAAVGAVGFGATRAYFSDTETSSGNTFTAGTIDIAIDDTNPWTGNYNIGDLKPGETGNIYFDIQNVGQNPVNVSKNVGNFVESTGTQSEPECAAEHGYDGCWDNGAGACDWHSSSCLGGAQKNDVQTQIIYDLSVKVYKAGDDVTPIWWQSIYTGAAGETLSSIYGNNQYVALGMIPVGGHMKVTQSYHFSANAGNEYQGDKLSFDITIKADQLAQGDNGLASVVLENKGGDPDWLILSNDSVNGTLTYKTTGSKFEYTFTGKAPLNSHDYVLAVGYNASTDVDKEIGTGSTDSNGDIIISGSVVTGNLTNAKAWLVPTENWVGGAMGWTDWPASAANFLWETGLINYTQN